MATSELRQAAVRGFEPNSFTAQHARLDINTFKLAIYDLLTHMSAYCMFRWPRSPSWPPWSDRSGVVHVGASADEGDSSSSPPRSPLLSHSLPWTPYYLTLSLALIYFWFYVLSIHAPCLEFKERSRIKLEYFCFKWNVGALFTSMFMPHPTCLSLPSPTCHSLLCFDDFYML
jgi:hypothetical protein